MNLASKILKGNKKAAAQLITLLERRAPLAAAEMRRLIRHAGRAHRVGVTGAQGVGKSTLIDQLIEIALKNKKKIGIIAVDPTSPLTGGAFLGDRIRMQRHAAHPGVFIRSMAARGARGGLSPALHDALRVLDALGCDLIFVETVGVGQDEIEIASATDTTLLVLTPQSGDKIQTIKAGLFEACDLLVLNKCDSAGAQALAEALKTFVPVPFVQVSAAKARGIEKLYNQIEQHWRESRHNGSANLRRQQNLRAEIRQKLEEAMMRNIDGILKKKSTAYLIKKSLKDNYVSDKTIQVLSKMSS